MTYRVEVYTQYSDGEIELEEEYEGEVDSMREAKNETEQLFYNAWYGSYVKVYIDGNLMYARTRE